MPRKAQEERAAGPDEELLHLKDGGVTLEVRDLVDLRTQLREKYPHAAFERTLRSERDREAEERRERALKGLMDVLVEAVVQEMIEEESRGDPR